MKSNKETPLTEPLLKRLGFTCVKNESYINNNQWFLQVTECNEDEPQTVVNRDGTWFDGIGTYNFRSSGEMGVNVLCRGNYVCNSLSTIEQVQRLFFAMTQKELPLKEIN